MEKMEKRKTTFLFTLLLIIGVTFAEKETPIDETETIPYEITATPTYRPIITDKLPPLKDDIADTLPSYIDPLPTVKTNESLLENTPLADNVTLTNATDEQQTNATQSQLVNCLPAQGSMEVQLVNDTELMNLLAPDGNITAKNTPARCVCVLFYSKYCPFSSLAAPHFNALPRAFPDVKMVAINAMMYHLFNTQNGIVGVPSVLLFHNGKVSGKFNESDYTLEQFSRFVVKHTGIQPEEKSFVTSADFAGPVSSVPSKDVDVFLAVSWVFIILCGVYYFMRSKWWMWIVETVQSNWRESEAQAQHEHAE